MKNYTALSPPIVVPGIQIKGTSEYNTGKSATVPEKKEEKSADQEKQDRITESNVILNKASESGRAYGDLYGSNHEPDTMSGSESGAYHDLDTSGMAD